MAVEAYGTVKNCISCAMNRVTVRKNSKHMRLFPEKAPLEFVSIDLLGELITTAQGNRFLLVITDRFSKLVRTVPLRRITAAIIAREFVRHWVLVYGHLAFLLSDNGGQFTSKFFQDVCRILGIKNLFTKTYHPQCNGQVERFNRTILAALRHYVADHPKNWDLFTDALTYAYNTQINSSTGVSPFEVVLSRRPPALSLKAEPTLSDSVSAKHHAIKWKKWLAVLMSTAQQKLAKRQAKYKLDFDKRLRRYTETIRIGDRIFVRKEYTNPQVERKHKLSPVAEEPYDVVEVNQDTVVIETEDKFRERISRDRVMLAPKIVDTPSAFRHNAAIEQEAARAPPEANANTLPTQAGSQPSHGLADALSSTNEDGGTPASAVHIRRPIASTENHPCIPASAAATESPASEVRLENSEPLQEDDGYAEQSDCFEDPPAPRPMTRLQSAIRSPSDGATHSRLNTDANSGTPIPSYDDQPLTTTVNPKATIPENPDPRSAQQLDHSAKNDDNQSPCLTRRSARLQSRQTTDSGKKPVADPSPKDVTPMPPHEPSITTGTPVSSEHVPAPSIRPSRRKNPPQRRVTFARPESTIANTDTAPTTGSKRTAPTSSDDTLPQDYVPERIPAHAHADDGEHRI